MEKKALCNFCNNVINDEVTENVALIKDDKFISDFEQTIGTRRVRPAWKDNEGMNCAIACPRCLKKYQDALLQQKKI